MPSSRGRAALGVVYVILAILAWIQVFSGLEGGLHDQLGLVAFQAGVGTAALVAAWGCWRLRRWASAAAFVHGVVTASMLLSLAPLLELPPSARGGLWSGAAAVMAFAIWAAWYLRDRRIPVE